MGSSRLYQIGNVLGVQVQWFFPDATPKDVLSLDLIENLKKPETLKLVRAYYSIEAKKRPKIYEFIGFMGSRSANKQNLRDNATGASITQSALKDLTLSGEQRLDNMARRRSQT
jgi:hypothetical protein